MEDQRVNRKISFFLSAFTAACAAVSTTAVADTPQAKPSMSRAAILSDAQLDQITAGTVVMQHVIINHGNAVAESGNSNTHLHCVNCVPAPVDKGHLHNIVNPSHTVTHCKGVSC